MIIRTLTVYYDENVPLFRRNGYRKSGAMILRYRAVEYKILFSWDKPKGFQSLPAECRGKLDAVIAVTLKGLIGWEL